MIKTIVFGTFDILHKGHLFLFNKAKKKGDFLTVVVARDETVKKIKGKKPLKNEKQRLNEIKLAKIADKVILGNKDNYYKVLIKEKPDIICLGYDQFDVKLNNKILKELGLKSKLIRLKPYKQHTYKGSKIKEGGMCKK